MNRTDEPRTSYDFSQSERGKHAERYRIGRIMPGDQRQAGCFGPPRSHPDCTFVGRPAEGEHSWADEAERIAKLCTLNKPLLLVIPPEGIMLPCEAHPEGHFMRRPRVRC